jgi:hypothetical protein
MIDLKNYKKPWKRMLQPGLRVCTQSGMRLTAALAAAFIVLAMATHASAQVLPTADAGGYGLSVGATGSGEYVQYGSRKMIAVSPFVDIDTRRNLGIEAEAHFVQFRQTQDLRFSVYSIGVRYRLHPLLHLQPYAKGLVGIGDFNFPYNYANGRYLVVTGGGGFDYRLNNRIHFRVLDAEWQYWPEFGCGASGGCGAMSSIGASAGLRVNIR